MIGEFYRGFRGGRRGKERGLPRVKVEKTPRCSNCAAERIEREENRPRRYLTHRCGSVLCPSLYGSTEPAITGHRFDFDRHEIPRRLNLVQFETDIAFIELHNEWHGRSASATANTINLGSFRH